MPSSMLFISYAREDEDVVKRACRKLEEAGLSIWRDKEDIEPGAPSWPERVEKAIETAGAVVVFLSPNSKNSDWVTKEILFAQVHRIRIFPVLIAGDQGQSVPFVLVTANFVDLRATWNNLDTLISAIKTYFSLPQSVTPVITNGAESQLAVKVPPTLAIMGAKGGVGKTLFASCSAQILAGSGHDVAIVDFDMSAHGITNYTLQRPDVDPSPVKTVYDHFAAHAMNVRQYPAPDSEALWEITPAYLRERNRGRIWLIPSKNPDLPLDTFKAIANIPEPREITLLQEVYRILERITRQLPSVKWIIIDCGADVNPIYSAAFVAALSRYVIILPDPAFFGNIKAVRQIHAERYPKFGQQNMHVVVNRVITSADRARAAICRPIGYIPSNPDMEEESFATPIDFDLGYDDVFTAIHQCLFNTLPREHRRALPDEREVTIRPWVTAFIEHQLAEKTLRSASTRVHRALYITATAALFLVVAVLLLNNIARLIAMTSQNSSERSPLDLIPLIIVGAMLAASIAYLVMQERRYRVLFKIAALSKLELEQQVNSMILLIDKANSATRQWLYRLQKEYEKKHRDEKIQQAADRQLTTESLDFEIGSKVEVEP